MSRSLCSTLGSTPVWKWVYPILWLTLITLFFRTTFYRPSHDETSTNINSLSNKSYSLPSISEYYNKVTHSSEAEPERSQQHLSADVNSSIKAGVIIETRRSAIIIPLILQFSAVLGPDWPIIIYTSAENFGSFSTSASLVRHQRSGRVVVRALADGVYFPSWDSVSAFLTTRWLWKDLAPAEHLLIFQADSILCGNAARSVEDFFEYDLIGAPIVPNMGIGYNGGLSLRKRSSILRVLDTWEWNQNSHPHPEDQWYYARMLELQVRDTAEGVEDGIKLPSMEIARTFAVETIDYPNPLGLHQPTRFLHEHMLALDEWCPEYKLATTDHIS